jgi:hypothetical protein
MFFITLKFLINNVFEINVSDYSGCPNCRGLPVVREYTYVPSTSPLKLASMTDSSTRVTYVE